MTNAGDVRAWLDARDWTFAEMTEAQKFEMRSTLNICGYATAIEAALKTFAGVEHDGVAKKWGFSGDKGDTIKREKKIMAGRTRFESWNGPFDVPLPGGSTSTTPTAFSCAPL